MAVTFHLMNARLFNIGIFPWMMLAATVVFLPESWFRWADLPRTPSTLRFSRVVLGGLAVYMLLQLLVPLRHLAYPSDPSWSESGHMFAWHMKLRSKYGDVRFFAYMPQSGQFMEVAHEPYLTPRQRSKMPDHPEMVRHFANFLGAELQATEGEPVVIYAWAMASLNGRPSQLLIDPSVDLTQTTLRFGENDWVLPLHQRQIDAPYESPLLVLQREDYAAVINIGSTMATADNYALIPGDCVVWMQPDTVPPVLPCDAVDYPVAPTVPTLTDQGMRCVGEGQTCVASAEQLLVPATTVNTQPAP